jgi:type I restriction enzyme, S subunit
MSFPRYSDYKDSGVDWLGEVPGHWSMSRLGFEGWVRARLGWKGLKAEEYVDDGYVLLSTPNIKGENIDFNNVNYIDEGRYQESLEIALRIGDVLLAKDGSTLGTVNVVRDLPRPATVNSSIAVISPGERMNGIFLYYLFQSQFMQSTIQRIKGGMGVPHLFQEDLNKFYVPCPSLLEQSAVVAFLDRETAKIDALVVEQERLIELLKEKRLAVISHAVTKGLNPDAPMKDSGIEWLGNVPEHWKSTPIKYLATVGNGSTPDRSNQNYWLDGNYPWLNSSIVNQDEVTDSEQFVTEIALTECHLPVIKPPAILIGLTGQGKTRGMSAILLFESTINQHLAYVKPNAGKMLVTFLKRVFDFAYSHLRTESEGVGSTKGAITCEQISRLSVPVPPLEEQSAIVAHLDRETAKLDALVAEAQRAIDLLKERRAALISAAVTGRIDVRGLVADNHASAERAPA